jgi:segregation and condensation protein A
MVDSEFALNLPEYSGPFEVLLSLISKKKLEISELALLAVANEFVNYVKTLESHKYLTQTSDFLVIASSLMALKAQSLLPHSDQDSEEYQDLAETQNLLLARLIQYKVYKTIGQDLAMALDSSQIIYHAQVRASSEPVLAKFPSDFKPGSLAQIYVKLLLSQQVRVPQYPKLDLITVRSSALILARKLAGQTKIRFSELFQPQDSELVIVATFLAVLELFRNNLIQVHQKANFTEIELQRSLSSQKFSESVETIFTDKLEKEYHG